MNLITAGALRLPGAAAGQLGVWLRTRPVMTVEAMVLLTCGYFAVACNTAFFRAAAATGAFEGMRGWIVAASLVALIVAIHATWLLVAVNRWTVKPMLVVLLLATSVAAHLMGEYRVYLDPDMMQNVLHTDSRESGELFSRGLLLSLLLRGVLPSVLVWRTRVRRRPVGRAILVRFAFLAMIIAVAVGAAFVSFQSVSALMRNHHEIRYLVTPGNYLVSLARVVLDDGAARKLPRTPVGAGATIVGRPAHARPRLLVIVVGETVRARNWGLNGHVRQTTPELQRIGVVNFPHVEACGSSTEVSVPCMFSPSGRAHYDRNRTRHSESLLHVLAHAGISTDWIDNQGGCKSVCEGLPFESVANVNDPAYCDAEGCLDEVMLRALADRIDHQQGDAVVVLHQLGAHGPSYYKRYPRRLERFTPACRTPELGKCSREQIVNAYDNAVLYTDEFLARTIGLLAGQSSRDTALVYLSDHGESLGEGGLYLHGVPYAIAPDVQTSVPMVMWFSSGFADSRGIDVGCIARKAESIDASHDNLFHTVLGLMQVRAPEYRASLDLLRGCVPGSA